MGEIGVGRLEGVLRTLVGSCVGVAVYDRRLKVAALAHIVLPDSQGNPGMPGKFADTAIPEAIRRVQELVGGQALRLSAKLVGGANMFSGPRNGATIGEQNIRAVERLLEERRITVVARDLGGEQGRRVTLDVATGVLTVDVVGAATITI
jgi:chemotaxis protein CheD